MRPGGFQADKETDSRGEFQRDINKIVRWKSLVGEVAHRKRTEPRAGVGDRRLRQEHRFSNCKKLIDRQVQ